MGFPNQNEIEEVLAKVTDDDFSNALPSNASHVDKTKHQLCKKFIGYLGDEAMSQAQLARKLQVNRSRINCIVKYKIENFTIDRLYELWSTVDPEFELKVS